MDNSVEFRYHDRICEYSTLAGTKRAFEGAGLYPKM